MVRTNQPARKSTFFVHVCGCYFVDLSNKRQYLPQVSLKSHTSINSQSFSTRLVQTFHNTNEASLPQVRYTFPLYDGVTVNGYTISYAGNTLKGVVQQKDEARKTYQEAVDSGQTAGLLETLPAGVFGVTLGNVPSKTDIVVEIFYCGELKHDAGVDGLRYNLPTSIAPRYGEYPGSIWQQNTISQGGISITVDVDTGDAPVRRVQSPSHPIAVSMGELSVARKNTGTTLPFNPSQASATLALGTTELGDDFILQLVVDNIGNPQAVIEKHTTFPNHRAIMTTLVPKFALKSGHPEIVFVADQSGSMAGSKNDALKAALKIFVKSLPVGVRFNICAFGSTYQFLWPKSQAYNEQNVETAINFVESLTASYGGTHILEPLIAAFKNRLGDLPLEVMLLTDGEIWGEQAVFEFINKQIVGNKVDGRVFALGIGSDVSHTLVEGVARAGNGFAQFVTAGNAGNTGIYEDLDQKIIRMLKAALFAHTNNYQLEVHYEDVNSAQVDDDDDDDDDFELIDKVTDCLNIKDNSVPGISNPPNTSESGEKVAMSFFDSSANLDEPSKPSEGSRADRYAHLPAIATPKILQAPTAIPALFPFNRTTVYLLLGPDTSQRAVKSVTLRATSVQGPLELNIPVRSIGDGSVIHQLAARKAIQDLEEGRGWLSVATAGNDNQPVKQKYASRLDELAEREAVTLGEKFQVAGKWTSFVAVNDKGQDGGKRRSIDGPAEEDEAEDHVFAKAPRITGGFRRRDRARDAQVGGGGSSCGTGFFANSASHGNSTAGGFGNSQPFGSANSTEGSLFFENSHTPVTATSIFPNTPNVDNQQAAFRLASLASNTGGLFSLDFCTPTAAANPFSGNSGTTPQQTGSSGGFGASNTASTASNTGGALFGSTASPSSNAGGSLFGSSRTPAAPAYPMTPAQLTSFGGFGSAASNANHTGGGLFGTNASNTSNAGGGLFGNNTSNTVVGLFGTNASTSSNTGGGLFGQQQQQQQNAQTSPIQMSMQSTQVRGPPPPPRKQLASTAASRASFRPPISVSEVKLDLDDFASDMDNHSRMRALIDRQTFSGAWRWDATVCKLLSIEANAIDMGSFRGDDSIAATMLVVAFLENKVSEQRGAWEMVVEKARMWLEGQPGMDDQAIADMMNVAAGYL